jgi:hypothetical protein
MTTMQVAMKAALRRIAIPERETSRSAAQVIRRACVNDHEDCGVRKRGGPLQGAQRRGYRAMRMRILRQATGAHAPLRGALRTLRR